MDALLTLLFFVALWLAARYLKWPPRPGAGDPPPDSNKAPTTKHEP